VLFGRLILNKNVYGKSRDDAVTTTATIQLLQTATIGHGGW